MITTNFAEGTERNRAFGVFSAVAVARGAIGLIAGGILTSWLSWRWVLFVNVPIGVVLASLAPPVHHRVRAPAGDLRPRRRPDLDGGNDRPGLRVHPCCPGGLERPGTIVSFTAAAVLLAVFLSIETRIRQPITRCTCSATATGPAAT